VGRAGNWENVFKLQNGYLIMYRDYTG